MNVFQRIFSRRRLYTELSQCVQEHIDERTEELMGEGLSKGQARAEAIRQFGNRALIEQRSREVWQWPRLENLWTDTTIACRQLWRTPGFTLIVLLIMGCGIGASTAIFSILDSILFAPYAFRDPGQIVVWREIVQEAVKQYPTVPDNFRHFLYLKSHASTIQDAALVQNASLAIGAGEGHPRIVNGLNVSPNFFSVLGVNPTLGRTFLPEEGQPGKDNVALISWATWQDIFHGDPNAVGGAVKIQGKMATVVGVLPRNFEFPVLNEMSGAATPGQSSPYGVFRPFVAQGDDLTSDDADFAFLVVARLKPGISARQATTELNSMLSGYAATNHLSIHLGALVVPLSQEVTGNIGKALWLLFAAVLGLLLIACVNLASLQLARAVVRDRDNGLRAALGAGRIRLVQSALLESVVLCLIGGAVGVLLALCGIRLFTTIAPENLPRLHEIHLTWKVLLFACAISAISALLSGIFPALRSLRSDPQRTLQVSSKRVIRAGQAFIARRVLVLLEIACTVGLLIVTGLVVRSFSRVVNQPHDFNASRVILGEVNLLSPRYQQPNDSSDAPRSEFIDRALNVIRSGPGVEFAAITSEMPLSGDAAVHSIYRPDHPLPESKTATANLRNVSPEYFETMQTRLIAGHEFTAGDRVNSGSAIISQRAAQAAWPDTQALGRKFKFDGRIYTVTGIAADARIANLKENVPVVYLPFWHDPPVSVFFLVRTTRTLDEFAPAFRKQIWDIDPEAAIPVIETMDKRLAQSVAPERLLSVVLSSFGIAALVLAIFGVYGVLAYSVSLRTPEFGIRIALGSTKAALIRVVLLEALIPVGGGIMLGLLGSYGATRAVRSLLYQTSAADPASIAGTVGILVAATFVAAYLPAYRASRVDPMKVLRQE